MILLKTSIRNSLINNYLQILVTTLEIEIINIF